MVIFVHLLTRKFLKISVGIAILRLFSTYNEKLLEIFL